ACAAGARVSAAPRVRWYGLGACYRDRRSPPVRGSTRRPGPGAATRYSTPPRRIDLPVALLDAAHRARRRRRLGIRRVAAAPARPALARRGAVVIPRGRETPQRARHGTAGTGAGGDAPYRAAAARSPRRSARGRG